jgi:hypothetical protein
MPQEALTEYEKAMAHDGISPKLVYALRHGFEKKGWDGFWQQHLTGLLDQSKREYVSPYAIASDYARLRDRESAFRYLDEAYGSRDDALTAVKADRDLDGLHSDARYPALLKKDGPTNVIYRQLKPVRPFCQIVSRSEIRRLQAIHSSFGSKMSRFRLIPEAPAWRQVLSLCTLRAHARSRR